MNHDRHPTDGFVELAPAERWGAAGPCAGRIAARLRDGESLFAAVADAIPGEPLLDSPSLLDALARDPLIREALGDRAAGLDHSPWELLFPEGPAVSR
jgi:hypothetical protein